MGGLSFVPMLNPVHLVTSGFYFYNRSYLFWGPVFSKLFSCLLIFYTFPCFLTFTTFLLIYAPLKSLCFELGLEEFMLLLFWLLFVPKKFLKKEFHSLALKFSLLLFGDKVVQLVPFVVAQKRLLVIQGALLKNSWTRLWILLILWNIYKLAIYSTNML